MTNNNLTLNDPNLISTQTLLLHKDRFYPIEVILEDGPFSIENWLKRLDSLGNQYAKELSADIAYIDGPDYFYIYRGEVDKDIDIKSLTIPGIYKTKSLCTHGDVTSYITIPPTTPEYMLTYNFNDKLTTLDCDEIRNKVLNHEVVIFNTPDTSHSVIPAESAEDDLLKRVIKRAISEKGIDLDQYKARFISKNMLFNTKQVLRGDNRLSMLLFDRCTEAFNLKYTIVVEENGGEVIGIPLSNQILISSQDVYDANGAVTDEMLFEESIEE